MLRGGLNLQPSAYLFMFWKNNKTAAMPPAYAHAKREFAALKGRLGSRVTFEKVTKVALWKGLTFPERYEKSAFRFTKSIKEMVFLLLFASAKSIQKQTEGCGPPDSGERFKTRAVGF